MGSRLVDLRSAPGLLPAYVALRNRWQDLLLTDAVTGEGTAAWLGSAAVTVACLEEEGVLLGAAVLYGARGGRSRSLSRTRERATAPFCLPRSSR